MSDDVQQQQETSAADLNGGQGGTTAESKNPETPGPVPYDRFKEVNDQLAELKRWRSEQEKAAKAKATEAEKAEQERLAEQQKWQELAQKRQAALDELQPYQEQAERYKGALAAVLEAQRKGLPEHVIELLDKLDPVDQLEYIAKHAERLQPKSAPAQINAGAVPSQKPPQDNEAKIQDLRQRFRI